MDCSDESSRWLYEPAISLESARVCAGLKLSECGQLQACSRAFKATSRKPHARYTSIETRSRGIFIGTSTCAYMLLYGVTGSSSLRQRMHRYPAPQISPRAPVHAPPSLPPDINHNPWDSCSPGLKAPSPQAHRRKCGTGSPPLTLG